MNKDPIGISKVKGPGAVPVSLDRLLQPNTMSHNPSCHQVNIFRSTNDKSDVMNVLNRARMRVFRELVDSEIIASGSQINIVWIGLPFDSHTKDIAVEIDGVPNIPDIERHMPKT